MELPHELVYCSRCGNNLRPANLQPAEALMRFRGGPGIFACAIAFVTLGGFFATLFVFMGVVTRGLPLAEGAGALAGGILLTTLLVDWMLVRLLKHILKLAPEAAALTAPATPKGLREPAPRWLDEPRIPVDSVTDHTTRTLPPVYAERTKPQ
jgi:hypothetical protein